MLVYNKEARKRKNLTVFVCACVQITYSIPFALASIFSTTSGAGQGKTTIIIHLFNQRLPNYFIFNAFCCIQISGLSLGVLNLAIVIPQVTINSFHLPHLITPLSCQLLLLLTQHVHVYVYRWWCLWPVDHGMINLAAVTCRRSWWVRWRLRPVAFYPYSCCHLHRRIWQKLQPQQGEGSINDRVDDVSVFVQKGARTVVFFFCFCLKPKKCYNCHCGGMND